MLKQEEYTIFYYDGSYQYDVQIVLGTTHNNIYAGVINKLKSAERYRPSYVGGYWAEIKSETGMFIARVSLGKREEPKVGFLAEGGVEWYTPTLLNPDYELVQIARL